MKTPRSNQDVLTPVECVRLRPAMYIGGTSARELRELVEEVLTNGIEEFLAGHATSLNVILNADGSLTYEDNGRAVPTQPIAELQGRSLLEVVLTEYVAGDRFQRSDDYHVGRPGVHFSGGMLTVNALSEQLAAETWSDGELWRIDFVRGSVAEGLRKIGTGAGSGVRVTFRPDREIFPEPRFDEERLASRLRELACLNSGLRITLHGRRISRTNEFHCPDGLAAFVRHVNHKRTPLYSEVVRIAGERGSIRVETAFQQTMGFSETVHTFVNGRRVEGGTHLDAFRGALAWKLANYAWRHRIVPRGVSIASGCLWGLTLVMSVRVPDPQFEDQTKVKVTNSDVGAVVADVVEQGLEDFFQQYPAIAHQMVEKALLNSAAFGQCQETTDQEAAQTD